ncbi:MAG TPA: HU family DNA-binding protein [Gammaproteobacteria bacterium]|nr:HU family DNA-binding protein [Gammaproteobacteria bacterium]
MAAKKKAATKTKAKVAKAPKAPPVNPSKMPTKSEVYRYLADSAGISRKQVAGVFDALAAMIKANLTKGSGFFAVPGLMKIKVVKKPATKAREGINPFTGEKMIFKAKPARKVVKVMALKGLKAMVA